MVVVVMAASGGAIQGPMLAGGTWGPRVILRPRDGESGRRRDTAKLNDESWWKRQPDAIGHWRKPISSTINALSLSAPTRHRSAAQLALCHLKP